MIDRVVGTCLRLPLLAVVLATGLAICGWRAFQENPKDAIPDIAENQVIVYSEWMGRSPTDVDEQVTYPLTVALQGVPQVREIRATSGFGWSIIYVVFTDRTDFYWARSRVLERLNVAENQLPSGVRPRLGPDATALGQIYWYTVENGWYAPEHPGLRFSDEGTLTLAARRAVLEQDPALEQMLAAAVPFTDPLNGKPLQFSTQPLDRLRSIQDFTIKLALEGVEGVSEVASIGGFVRQYQIDVNPDALRAFKVPLSRLVDAVQNANIDVGAKVIEENGMEILIRGIGFLGGAQRNAADRAVREQAVIRDLEHIVIHAENGTPVQIDQVATVTVGPDFRRGALDRMGAQAIGAAVTMRFGEDPLSVIDRVRHKIDTVERGLPPGVRINPFYDRTDLIHETTATLSSALSQELIITMVVVVLFLLHFRSSVVIAVTLPLAVLFAFVGMEVLNLPSNIMSLAGIAIAIGTMVDMSIVMLENIYQGLSDRRGEYIEIQLDARGHATERVNHGIRKRLILESAVEVVPAIVTAVSTTVVSFVPVFFLEGQAARLFTPLAWTKTFCMVGAVVLALTVVPPFAAVMLRSRRMAFRTVLPLVLIPGLMTGMGWWNAARVHAALATWTAGVEAYLGWPRWLVAVAAGLAVGVVVTLLLTERLKPIESNITTRVIHWVYRHVLRWVLRHPLLFLSIPAALVLCGLSIWLGWGVVLRPVLYPLEAAGLTPIEWSSSRWLQITLAAILGLVLTPLILDTLNVGVALFRRAHVFGPSAWNWGRRVVALAVFVGVGFLLKPNAFTGSATAALAFVLPLPTGTAAQPAAPLKTLMQQPGIGQEFMPPLDEGDFLYMPSVLPAGSINTVMDVMRQQDAQFARIPEVLEVVGKLGRIDSPLDPAPVGMIETMILLRPREEWPLIEDPQFENRRRPRTPDEIWAEIKDAGRFPGVLPSVQLQPIRTRIEMLSTGLNAKIGIKIYGDSIERCEQLAIRVEQLLRDRLEHAQAINAVRISGKPYLEFRIDREAIARHGVDLTDVQQVIEVAIGGRNLTTTYEGLDRYPVRIRYERELRDEVPDLGRILVPTPAGAQIPISELAEIRRVTGPMSVRREGAKFVGYVTMSNQGVDETTLVANGQRIIDEALISGELDLPEGYFLRWAGSYERNLRAKQRLAILLPLVLLINFLLIYLQFKRWSLTAVIFLAIPVAFSGGFILIDAWPQLQDTLYHLGLMDQPSASEHMYLTVAVWIGFIALFGIAVDDGIVIGTYLDQSFSRTPITRYEEIEQRVMHAGLRRIRPTLMTTCTTLAPLSPVLLSTGRGSDVMTPMALPVFGGMAVALITILVVPVCYCLLKQTKWKLGLADQDFQR